MRSLRQFKAVDQCLHGWIATRTLPADEMRKKFRASALRIVNTWQTPIKKSFSSMMWLLLRSRLNRLEYTGVGRDTSGTYYVEQFLRSCAPECRGRFLEFGDPYWRKIFDPAAVEQYDSIDVEPRPHVTIVGDIQHCPHVADDTFDVIVCTMVLEHVPNPFLAVAELRRMLKPGGLLLATVPAAFPYHACPKDYWRFTRDSLALLFENGFREVEYRSYGNLMTVIACYWFWMKHQLPKHALEIEDPDNATVLAVKARK